jgi:hypothetical protein
MSDAFAWVFIGVGMLIGSIRLTRLTRSRATREMNASRARSGAWLDVSSCVVPIAAGVGLLGRQAKDYVLVGAVWCAAFAILGLGTILYVRARSSAG